MTAVDENVKTSGSGEIPEGIKICPRCGESKLSSEFFSEHLKTAGRPRKFCRVCYAKNKAEKGYVATEEDGLASSYVKRLSRVDKFLKDYVKLTALTDDELFNRYITDDDGKPVPIKTLDRPRRFQNAWSREVSHRLNQYMIDKTPRALEVMYEIMDSELVEPGDRIAAAKFIIERTMGKTPDIVLTGGMDDKPYMGILDSIESGSREDYRKNVESTRLAIESATEELQSDGSSQIIDVEEVQSGFEGWGETSTDGDNGSARSEDNKNESEVSSEQTRIRDLRHDDGNGESSWNDHDGEGFSKRVQDKQEIKKRAEEIRKARAEAKRRRFVGRAVGATTITDLPFLIEWRVIDNINSPYFGKFKFKLIHPKDVTEKVYARVVASNDPLRHAEALEAAALKAAASMADSDS